MTLEQDFCPEWASPPGDTIVEILRERGISKAEFAHQIGCAQQKTEALLEGRATITIAIARRLQDILGASVEFWMSRDFQYRKDIARLRAADEEWLTQLPIGDMIKYGWLQPTPHPADEMDVCLQFFDVPSVSAWRQKYAALEKLAAFRTSSSFDSRFASVAAWLRQGEIESDYIKCAPWNPKQFTRSLEQIRSLTREKNPNIFLPKLKKICSNSGVAVAIVRAPSGCRASGAARFLSPNKALLQLSFRYLTDDHFWFTFFHEAAHIILHERKGTFLEGTNAPLTVEEEEANDFASRILIPKEFQPELLRLSRDGRNVIKFAMHVGISPGIVVGQLQHLGKLRHNQLNSLKRRFSWVD